MFSTLITGLVFVTVAADPGTKGALTIKNGWPSLGGSSASPIYTFFLNLVWLFSIFENLALAMFYLPKKAIFSRLMSWVKAMFAAQKCKVKAS